MSVNKLILVGRLGADPEMKHVGDSTVTEFSMATEERWKDKSGELQKRTEWTTVVVWGKQAEPCAKYLSKGREVYVEGRKQTRSWEDKEGAKHYKVECIASDVQFLGGGKGEERSGESSSSSRSNEPSGIDDDIPF